MASAFWAKGVNDVIGANGKPCLWYIRCLAFLDPDQGDLMSVVRMRDAGTDEARGCAGLKPY
jgi:hypothetical protein